MVFQIYLPCYFATEIYATSENLTSKLFHSEWFYDDKEYGKLVKIFMEFAKKPIEFAAIGVFVVNLENFTTICNSAYSLYAVFKENT
jgi:hypothetical protein